MKFATKAIHDGQEPDPRTGAVNVPVWFSSTFKQDGIGNFRSGFEYARTGNPSRQSLETTIAALEDAQYAACFASGSAATAAILNLLQPGDHFLSTIDVYGGTYRICQKVLAKYGIAFEFLAASEADQILAAIRPNTKMIWIETPTNPLLNVIDIARVASGHPAGITLVVDNTFASPAFQTPLNLGADIVVHSTTKYLGGHSDVVGGALATRDAATIEAIKFYQNAAGGVPGPMDCYLVQRGIKTLALRMERHQFNASKIAWMLTTHPKVEQVYFPGLPDHPGHEIAKRQMLGWSGMVSFRIQGGRPAVDRFVERVRLFALAESLGGVESLVCYPYTMTHAAIPEADKQRIGITPDLIRLSVGIEDVEDLLGDVERALE
jgi:cystathionine beta-lyase/cystathionine gamma-synthase